MNSEGLLEVGVCRVEFLRNGMEDIYDRIKIWALGKYPAWVGKRNAIKYDLNKIWLAVGPMMNEEGVPLLTVYCRTVRVGLFSPMDKVEADRLVLLAECVSRKHSRLRWGLYAPKQSS